MGFTVSVDHPHFPEGTEFNVGNLGRVPNGGSMEVDEESERVFLMSEGLTLDEAFAEDAIVNTTGATSLDQTEIDQVKEQFAAAEEATAVPVIDDPSSTDAGDSGTPPADETPPPADSGGTTTSDTGTVGTEGGGL